MFLTPNRGICNSQLSLCSHRNREGYDSPYIHVFHAHYHISRVVLEGAVECHNPVVIAIVHDSQLPYNALAHLVLSLDMYNLGTC